MKANRLSISTSKTNFILFHSPKSKPRKTLNVKIDGNAINEVQSVKYLGVDDSNLTWKPRISQLSLKLSKAVGVLSKIRYFVNSDVLVMLYYALIFSFLNYGIETWGLTYPSYLKPISIIQKKCIRIMTFSEPQSHSEPLLRSLGLLKFTDLITFQILNFIHKWAHNLLPPSFNHFFRSTSSADKYSTRQSTSGNLFLKCVGTTRYGLRSLQFLGPKL